MSKTLVVKGFYREKSKNDKNWNDESQQKRSFKNFADYFFWKMKIDTSTIDIANSGQISKLIHRNIDHITKWIFNNINREDYVFVGMPEDQIKNFLGKKSFELINQKYNELVKDINEVCYFIKNNNQNPEETLDLLGINYKHSNLPSECEDLF